MFLCLWNIKWLCVFTHCPLHVFMPLLHTFAYDAHTHTLWHDECVMPWLNHGLMFSIFTCHIFWITLSIPVFRFLIRSLCFELQGIMLCFVIFAALFCRWLHEKSLLSVVTRGNAWMIASFAPFNILSNTTITLRRLQSFRSDLWILLNSRNPSSLVVLKERVGKNSLAISLGFVNHWLGNSMLMPY